MSVAVRSLALIFILPFISAWGTMIAAGIVHANFLFALRPVGYGPCLAISYVGSSVALLVLLLSSNIVTLIIGLIVFLPFVAAWGSMIVVGIVHSDILLELEPAGYGPCLAITYLACLIGLLYGVINGGASLLGALSDELM